MEMGSRPQPARNGVLSCMALLLAATSAPAMAATQTWDGEAASANFGTATNWSANVQPSAPDTAAIDGGGFANQPVIFAGDSYTVSSVALSAGTLTVGGYLTTNSFTITGTGRLIGQIGGNLIGNVQANGGVIEGNPYITGNLSLLPLSTIGTRIFSPSSYDLLFVSGNVNLGGELVVDLGSYSGPSNASFDLITFGSRTSGSTFNSLIVSQPGALGSSLTYSDTGVRLNVFTRAVVPEPATWMMMISGFGAAGSVIRRRRAVIA